MKSLILLVSFVRQGIKLGINFSFIPSIGLGLFMLLFLGFFLGFPIGIAVGISLGAINGLILGVLTILILGKINNSQLYTYILLFLSSLITFITVFLIVYLNTTFYDDTSSITINASVDFTGPLRLSVLIALPIALLTGYASQKLSNWYLVYRQK